MSIGRPRSRFKLDNRQRRKADYSMSQDSGNQESKRDLPEGFDVLCDRFEQRWKSGPPPDLAEFLTDVPADQVSSVFQELLGIELEYRFRRGDCPTAEEYSSKHPQFRERIDAILAGSRRRAEDFAAFAAKKQSGNRTALHIRCPHCQYPIEIVDDRSIDTIACPSCGSNLGKREASVSPRGAREGQGKTIGQFELIEQLGEGSFGAVWKARDTLVDRVVALKIPRVTNLTSEELARFIREARLAAQCEHPHIVRVYEVGFAGDVFCIASQFIEGVSLQKYLSRERPRPEEAIEICAQIAEAMHCAHEAGVVHRDLKPANILLDSTRQPYITDFGLAKRETGELSLSVAGTILGTVKYMSPEQARGDSRLLDRRSDVYSLGTVLFELLSGEVPFAGTTEAVFQQLVNDEPPRVRKLNPRVSRDLESVCLRCLEKDRRKRFQTAQELADDLRRCQRGETTRTRPVSRPARAWRWCKRNRLVAALTCAVFLALTAGLIAALIGYAYALDGQQKASAALSEATGAIHDLLVQVSQSTLLNQPGAKPLRQKLLLTATERYGSIAKKIRDSRALRGDSARVIYYLARLAEDLKPPEEVLELLDEALRVQEELYRDNPDSADTLEAYGDTLNAIGTWHQRGEEIWAAFENSSASPQEQKSARSSREQELEAASKNLTEALHIRSELAKKHPTKGRRLLASTLMNLGLLRQQQLELSPDEAKLGEQALNYMKDAQRIREELLTTNPTDGLLNHDYAEALFNLGGYESFRVRLIFPKGKDVKNCPPEQLGKANDHFKNAKQHFETAQSRFASLVQASTGVDDLDLIDVRLDEQRCQSAIADVEWRLDPRSAVDRYQRVVDNLERMAKENPDVARILEESARICIQQARAARKTGDSAGAVRALEHAREVLDGLIKRYPETEQYKIDREAVLRGIRAMSKPRDKKP
jgi:hypothetical protein